MANALNRTTKEFRASVNTPDFPTTEWIINPDLSAVAGFPSRYWTITGDVVTLMTPAERDAVDDAEFAALIDITDGEGELFGDGNDGDVVVGADTTLTQDLYARKLTINVGVALTTAGFRVYAKRGVINNGTIRNNGAVAVGATGGGGAATGTLTGGAAGATGTNAAGANGTTANSAGVLGHGGRGGDGGVGSNGAAGTGGSVTSNNNARVRPRRLEVIIAMADVDAGLPGLVRFAGGGGGGAGGGGGGANVGGGGGGGGGIVIVCAPSILNGPGASIEARGGAGGAASGGNAAGGGGGGGGIVATVTGQLRDRGARNVDGGAPGNGSGSGTAGAQGMAGRLINLLVR